MPPHPREKTGRNDSCSCGSGKKYKHCCLKVARASDVSPWRQQRDASERLTQEMLNFARSRFAEDVLGAWLDFNQDETPPSLEEDVAEGQIFLPYLLFEWDPAPRSRRPSGQPEMGLVARSYLLTRGSRLEELEGLILEQATTQPLSFYEVVRCDPGEGMVLRDVLIGGETEVVQRLDPLFAVLAPGSGSAPRTPGASGAPTPAEQGYLHCGASGAGHFVKMVHNGIEYGLMAAYAEGLNIIRHANVGAHQGATDAETTPLRNPELYRYEIDVAQVAEVWRRGSVVASWLLDLTASALRKSPGLENFAGRVSDSGEGRWTLSAAVDEGIPAPTIAASLFSRFSSRGNETFANKILSAMRFEFGGHHEKPAEK